MKNKWRLMLVVLGALLLGALPAMAQEGYEFMPKGGKTLLLQLLGHPLDTAEFNQIVKSKRGADEWQASLTSRTDDMNERELRTLAEYLAVNMPLAGKVQETAALPADGKELAVNYCQFCHSFFSGYLMVERDAQGWLGTFETPFHREVELTEKERETFARYSAINMPMKFEDVPQELRF